MILFSIIIPTYKLPLEQLRQCIDSIYAYTDLSDVEIIVVANGQSKEVVEYLQSDRRIQSMVFDEPLGYAGAVNKGIQAASGQYLVLLNDDVILLPQRINEWLNRLRAPFDTTPQMGITGCLSNFIEELQTSFLVFFCVMITRRVIERIGLLDEGFLIGAGEDADYCLRAIKAGFQICNVSNDIGRSGEFSIGDFPIYHNPDTTVKQIKEFPEQFRKNKQRLVAKHSMDAERVHLGIKDAVPVEDALRWLWVSNLLVKFNEENGYKPTVLEIGCGTGYGVQFIKDYISKYIGLDKDQNAIEFARIDWGNDDILFDIKDYELDIIGKDWKPRHRVDFVICFEVLEHLDDFNRGLDYLFELGNNVAITVPYKEPQGFWGPYHKSWYIDENWIKRGGEQIWYQTFDNVVVPRLVDKPIRNMYVFYPFMENRQQKRKPKILAYTSTKNRYFTTLPLTVLSIALQTRPPDKYILFDDGEHIDLRDNLIYRCLFQLLDEKGIQWEVIFTPQHGQTNNHQFVNRILGKSYDWCWRIDDDEIAEPATIERFFDIIEQHKDEKIGAVGFSTRVPGTGGILSQDIDLFQRYGIKIEDILLPNIQSQRGDIVCYPEHLYSTFFYKPNIVDYNTNLSIVGHTEETQFTYDLYRAGYKLIVDVGGNIYHFQQTEGGIRSYNDYNLWVRDTQIFIEKYGLKNKEFFIICNPNGLGDNLAMAKAIQDNLHIFKDVTPIVATGCPQAYFNTSCKVVDMSFPSIRSSINPAEDNIYNYALQRPGLGNLYDYYVSWLNDIVVKQWERRLLKY